MKAGELAMCSVCAGAGRPVSGAKCICGGSGLEADEILGLRGEGFRLRDKMERFIALADQVEQDVQRYRQVEWTDGRLLTEREVKLVHEARLSVAKQIRAILEGGS